jgi:outer membrane lipoprotein SlyB
MIFIFQYKEINMKSIRITGIICLILFATACASSRSGKVYSQDQARKAHSVYFGTILTVDEVTIEGTQSGAGAILGGALGAAAGQTIGGGSGKILSTVGGAVGGGIGGAAIEKKVTTKVGVELTVELDNGEIIAVVQEKDDDYAVGDRVRMLKSSDGTTRIRQ